MFTAKFITRTIVAATAALSLAACSDNPLSPEVEDAAPAEQISAASITPTLALNTSYGIPSYSSGSGTAKMTYFSRANDYAAGKITLKNSSSTNCVYVQRKPVARYALDGDWKRSSTNLCGVNTTGRTTDWSDNFYLNYDGFAFRICKVVANQTDPCGSAMTIYP